MRSVAGSAIVTLLVSACAAGHVSTSVTGPSMAASSVASPSVAVSVAPSVSVVAAASLSLPLIEDVDVGGRTIHVECRGEPRPGFPAILLESGLDGSMANWSGGVRPALEAHTTVCAYSRAGLGGSDPAPKDTPRTIEDSADDLEAVIARAGIEGPFLIVAHSLGPWISMVYTNRHPDQVVGLVFVDPRGPAVTQGQLDALGDPAAGEPTAVTEVRDWINGGGLEDNIEQLGIASSAVIANALLDADGPFFGDRPVTVLSAADTIKDFPPLPDDVRDVWVKVWLDGQHRFTDESTRGTFTSVEGSGHMMTDDRPAAVIEAVESMLSLVSTR